jgi:pimeloyl-ACP methyl ester carboxylesterase
VRIWNEANSPIDDVTAFLEREPAYLRIVIGRDSDRWLLRYIEAVIGAEPPAWIDHQWVYEEVAFISAVIQGDALIPAVSASSEGRLNLAEYSIDVPQVGEQLHWERRPSRTSYDLAPLPWPVVDYSPYASDSNHGLRGSGLLVGEDCPSFPALETAFRAFRYDDFSTIGAAQIPTDLGRLRFAQPAAWLRRVRVSPTHLDGGYTALRAAAAHPDRIDRIVEFGWTVGAPTGKLPLLMRWGTIPALSRLMISLPGTESAVRMMFKQIGLGQALEAGRISKEAIGCYRALLNHTDTMRNEIAAGPRVIFPRGMDERIYLPPSLLSSIQTPIYFLWGEQDPFGDADIARAFVAQLPNSELELVPGAGHAVWMDDPDHAARVTRAFLRGNERPLRGAGAVLGGR